MKTLLSDWALMALVALLVVGGAGRLHSQGTAAVKTPVEQVQALKARNKELLEKQAAALAKLAEIEKEAAQLKIFTKRS